MKFHDVKENEWIWPKMGGYLLKCCDCGLVHEMDFAVVDPETDAVLNGPVVIFRARRVKSKKKKK